MSEEKKKLTDKETKKSKELSSEELDKVSGGIGGDRWETGYKDWKKDLAESKNPNGFGSTFDEWKQLQEVRKEAPYYGEARCPECGSWKTDIVNAIHSPCMGISKCRVCGASFMGGNESKIIWGAKGVSIYYNG